MFIEFLCAAPSVLFVKLFIVVRVFYCCYSVTDYYCYLMIIAGCDFDLGGGGALLASASGLSTDFCLKKSLALEVVEETKEEAS